MFSLFFWANFDTNLSTKLSKMIAAVGSSSIKISWTWQRWTSSAWPGIKTAKTYNPTIQLFFLQDQFPLHFFIFMIAKKNSRWPFSNKTAANVVIICVVVCCFPLLLLLLFFCTFVLLSLSSPSCCADLSFQCWLMWQEKVCQATRLLRAKTHLARCVTWFATMHAMSCVSFPKFWTYLCAEKNLSVFWHRSKKWSKVRSCECRDPGAVRGIVIVFSKCYNSSRDALTQWGGSFKREKNYKPEKDLPIESFVTTLIDGNFFLMTRTHLASVAFVAARNCMRQQVLDDAKSLPNCDRSQSATTCDYSYEPNCDKSTSPYYKVLLQYYSVLQNMAPYYEVLLQYYSVLQSGTPALQSNTTKNYHSSTTLYYKVPLQYYKALLRTTAVLSTTPVLLCNRKKHLDPRYIWNVIYNAWSNRSHPPTAPNIAPATRNDSHDNSTRPPTSPKTAPATRNDIPKLWRQSAEKQMKRALQWRTTWAWSPHDPNMKLQNWTRPFAELTFSPSATHFVRKLQNFALWLSIQISPNTAPATKSNAATSPNIAPATKSHSRMCDTHMIWNVIYIVRSNRCDYPTSPKIAPATKNPSHDWSSWPFKHHLQCAEQHDSPSNLTK